jgi:hypothetical protein
MKEKVKNIQFEDIVFAIFMGVASVELLIFIVVHVLQLLFGG